MKAKNSYLFTLKIIAENNEKRTKPGKCRLVTDLFDVRKIQTLHLPKRIKFFGVVVTDGDGLFDITKLFLYI